MHIFIDHPMNNQQPVLSVETIPKSDNIGVFKFVSNALLVGELVYVAQYCSVFIANLVDLWLAKVSFSVTGIIQVP